MRHTPLLSLAFVSVLTFAPGARALEHSSIQQYEAHLQRLRVLADDCEARAEACDPAAVGDDEQVEIQGLGAKANADSFEARYDWLRDALEFARKTGDKERADKIWPAEARLDEALREASGGHPAQSDLSLARLRANAILGHPEFATVHEDSIWQRMLGRIFLWLDRIFGHVAQFGQHSPWIGPVMEWGLIGLVLVGLSLWAMRVLQRQRVAVHVEAAGRFEPFEEAARNWHDRAEEQAARGEWREAVHCLYWATIALLEGRKFWKSNRSRTPREYVRLLEVGSTRRKLLQQQTQVFERIWYGQNQAARQDYEEARELHDGLRVA